MDLTHLASLDGGRVMSTTVQGSCGKSCSIRPVRRELPGHHVPCTFKLALVFLQATRRESVFGSLSVVDCIGVRPGWSERQGLGLRCKPSTVDFG